MVYYDEISGGYDELYKEEQLRKLHVIKQNLKIKNSDLLLDVGCGTGFSLELFNCRTIGVDSSFELLKKANGTVVNAKAENIPFPDNSFDIVISVTAIHNFDELEKAFLEISRVGKGSFVFSVLKKSSGFPEIEKLLEKYFAISKIILEEKDAVFICSKKKNI